MRAGHLQLDAGQEQDELDRRRSANASSAPTLIGQGRSPGAKGWSAARTAALRSAESACGPRRGTRAGVLAVRGASPRAAGAARACGYVVPTSASRPRSTAVRSSPRGPLGIGGLGQRPHDGDPLGAGRERRRRRWPARSRRSRRTGRRAGRRVADQLEPDRRPSRLGRRRVDRPDADVVDAGVAGRVDLRRAVRREPDEPLGPTSSRACATGVSSCPTWTPSAPAASTRSGRSLRINSAPWRVADTGKRRAAARISSSPPSLIRSWTMSTPPRSAASRKSSGRRRRGTGGRGRRWRRCVHASVWQDWGARMASTGALQLG